MTPSEVEPTPESPLMAAIDMGSNSFHMVVARHSAGEIRPVQKLAEKVMLASGLNDANELDEKAFQRGLDCLRRFADCLEGIDPKFVRCVGTNTLRQATNGHEFLRQARSILECPIDVVAGREEARLIYLGVSHSLASQQGNRLVFDIGGGSTEFIIGRNFEPLLTESLHLGCVAYRDLFFKDGKITPARFEEAVIRARVELSGIDFEYKKLGWDSAVGSSGTVKAIKNGLIENGWYDDGISLEGLYKLRDRLLQFDCLDDIDVAGIKQDRRSVFPSGLAILIGIFEQLNVTKAYFSDGAMREGILYDMLGRHQPEDVRERTITSLQKRCSVDVSHAMRVEATALEFFNQVKNDWDLGMFSYDWLSWGARVHEVGLMVSHSGYHKHGAYLLQYSDLSGFTRQDQQILATLVLSHRRRLREPNSQLVPVHLHKKVFRLILLLRLSVIYHRSRRETINLDCQLKVDGAKISMHFPANWRANHPLLVAELEQERGIMARANIELVF